MEEAYEAFKESTNPYYKLFSILNMVAYNMKINKFDLAEAYLAETSELLDVLPPAMLCGIESNYARLKAYKGDYKQSLVEMNIIYKKYFTDQVELILYDQIIEWCYVLDGGDVAYYAKDILERVTEILKNDRTAATAELMLLLANLYEADQDYQKSSALFRKSINIKSDLYKQNQQFITENTLRLLEMTKKNREMAKTSYRDALTGCLNRHALDKQGQELLDKSIKSGEQIAVIMFDIDYFKQYNDTYGHLEGDNCIVSITEAIMSTLFSEERYFYRYGGDEFLILWSLSNSNAETIAKEMLADIRALKLSHKKSPVSDFVTISIGISTITANNITLRSAVDAADMNLYKAKFSKRNCACVDELLID